MIKISPGNSKLGSIPNTSVIPITDCRNDAPCHDKCYAMKAWKQYPNVRNAWRSNSDQWKRDGMAAAKSVVYQLRKKKSLPYFRIHVAGDFINQEHLDWWIYIARKLPDTKFKAFTKRWDLQYGFISQNLLIGFSMWPGWSEMPPKVYAHMPKAWVKDGIETRIPNASVLCSNDCTNCKICWDDPPDNLYFKIH